MYQSIGRLEGGFAHGRQDGSLPNGCDCKGHVDIQIDHR